MNSRVILLIVFSLFAWTHGEQTETTTLDPNCIKNRVNASLFDNPDLGVGGAVEEDAESTTTTSGTSESTEDLKSSTNEENSSTLPSQVESTSQETETTSTISMGGQETSESTSDEDDQFTSAPGIPTSTVNSDSSDPVSTESLSSAFPTNSIATTGIEKLTSLTTILESSSAVSLIPTSTSVPCSDTLCSIQNFLQELLQRFLAILNQVLSALGLSNLFQLA